MNLKRGVNLGGFLSQCCHEKEHYDTFILEPDIDNIKSMGFDHVRLPIDYMVIETEDGQTKEEGYVYIRNVVDWAKKNGLNVILDLHKAYGYDFNFANTADNSLFKNEALMDRYVKLWTVIASHFANDDNVAFELLNEIVEEDVIEDWNDLIDRVVGEIRAIAKDTPIIYGGVMWNAATKLKFLRKPKYDNIIFTFHFYEPIIFTHQKAHWVEKMDLEKDVFYPKDMTYYNEVSSTIPQGATVVNCKALTMGPEFMEELMTEAVEAAAKNGVGLYCGEFGVIDQAPIEDTLRWFEDANTVFKKLDIGFCVWTYKKMDFGIIDEHYAPIIDKLTEIWNG